MDILSQVLGLVSDLLVLDHLDDMHLIHILALVLLDPLEEFHNYHHNNLDYNLHLDNHLLVLVILHHLILIMKFFWSR